MRSLFVRVLCSIIPCRARVLSLNTQIPPPADKQGCADEHTSKTLRVVSAAKTFEALCEYIDPDQIPVEYGGKLRYDAAPDEDGAGTGAARSDPLAAARRAAPHSVRWTSPFERQIRAHVESVLSGLKQGPGAQVEVVTSAAAGTPAVVGAA